MADYIRRWQERYAAGDFDDAGVEVQKEAGWVDWRCKDSALAGKTKKLAAIVMRLKDGGKLDLDSSIVTLYNGSTEAGEYDSVRFGTLSVNLDDPRYDGKWVVIVDGDVAFSCGTVTQLAKWLNTPEASRSIGKFEIAAGFTSDELKVAAAVDAKERFGADVEFAGIQRKYFRDARQADVWLDAQLADTPQGTVLAAIHGQEATAGYAIDM